MSQINELINEFIKKNCEIVNEIYKHASPNTLVLLAAQVSQSLATLARTQ